MPGAVAEKDKSRFRQCHKFIDKFLFVNEQFTKFINVVNELHCFIKICSKVANILTERLK